MITRVKGIRVGHWTDPVGRTGCTVVVPPRGTVGGVDVKGGAPGTRETDALRPGTLVDEVHAILLTGGSAFGLAAADGIVRALEAAGIGFDTGVARVPIVAAAVLFDLGVGDPAARPDAAAGEAALSAATDGPVEEGAVGAGTGATVAKSPDPAGGLPGGIGSAVEEEGDLIVGAIAAVNALGEIIGPDGVTIAANRATGSAPVTEGAPGWPGATNTVLVVVATNARLSKDRVNLVAQAGQLGISEAVRPAHTRYDGDTVFALATGEVEAAQSTVETLAIRAVASAIRRGVVAGGGAAAGDDR